MRHRKLSKSDISVSLLSLGTGSLAKSGGYNFGSKDVSNFKEMLLLSKELGINHIDTAPIYGFRSVEEELGMLNERSDFLITSKGGLTFSQGKKVRIDNHPQTLGSMLHESLKRMRLEYIDFYYLHWPDPHVPLEESLFFLQKQKKAGKIRAIGLSNFENETIDEALWEMVDVVQLEHHIFHDEKRIEQMAKHNVSIFVYGLLGKGALSGTNLEALEEKDYRKREATFQKLLSLQKKAKEKSLSIEPCLKVLENPLIHSGIIGARNQTQLKNCVDILETVT